MNKENEKKQKKSKTKKKISHLFYTLLSLCIVPLEIGYHNVIHYFQKKKKNGKAKNKKDKKVQKNIAETRD